MWDTAGAGILWVLLQFVPIVSFTLLQIWGRSFFPQKSIWLDSMFSEVSCLCACFTSFSKKHWKYTLVQCKCQPCYSTRLSNQLHTELIAVESSLSGEIDGFGDWRGPKFVRPRDCWRFNICKSDTRLCCQVVGLLVPQRSSVVCLLQYLQFNEASFSF